MSISRAKAPGVTASQKNKRINEIRFFIS
jgi:hypothetical protein